MQSITRFNLCTQNQVGEDFILCVWDSQFFAGFYLLSNIRQNILTDLSSQGARTTLGRNLLASFRAKSWPELGPNAQPRVRHENNPKDSSQTLLATIRPDFRYKHSADIGPNVWTEDRPEYQPNASAQIIWVTFEPKTKMAPRIRPEYFSTRAIALTNTAKNVESASSSVNSRKWWAMTCTTQITDPISHVLKVDCFVSWWRGLSNAQEKVKYVCLANTYSNRYVLF